MLNNSIVIFGFPRVGTTYMYENFNSIIRAYNLKYYSLYEIYNNDFTREVLEKYNILNNVKEFNNITLNSKISELLSDNKNRYLVKYLLQIILIKLINSV